MDVKTPEDVVLVQGKEIKKAVRFIVFSSAIKIDLCV